MTADKGISKLRATMAGLVLVAWLAVGGLVGCGAQDTQRQEADFTGVKSVCELSTLKCYYHNVATVNIEPSGPFSNILKVGYKRIWIEYTGTVEFGIDASKVEIDGPDERGVVRVRVPEIEILNVYLDRESIETPITEAGFFTEITAEEKVAGISAAQEDMRATASQNQALYTQAYDRARRVIKGYVQNVGASVGESYTVEWVD